MNKKPILLAILDGYGIGDSNEKNAIFMSKKPNMDMLFDKYPSSTLEASGEYVGLPDGQIGNSEVGHLTIGAGRVLYTGLSKINKAIQDDELKNNKSLLSAIEHANKNKSKIHIIGLASPGGVHSHENHIIELIKICSVLTKNVVVHAITDGRDVSPKSCLESINKLKTVCQETNSKLATISGRFYAMDRDKRWERVEKEYNNLLGKSENKFDDITNYIENQYSQEIFDEFIVPASVNDIDQYKLDDNDVVLFANFRPDRARELSHLIFGSNYYDFNPENGRKSNLYLAIMMAYEGITPSSILFPPEDVKNTLGEIISKNNMRQLRIAETEKYAHVTFFMDGGVEIDFSNEEKVLIDSPKVENYKETPKMSATKITNELIKRLKYFDLIILNFANPDMVGHTGDFNATKESIEYLDEMIKAIYDEISKIGGTMFITADHGNAEVMLDSNNSVVTSHTTNKVPLLVTDSNISLEANGSLADIAPTILEYMNLPIPSEMTGKSLIKKSGN